MQRHGHGRGVLFNFSLKEVEVEFERRSIRIACFLPHFSKHSLSHRRVFEIFKRGHICIAVVERERSGERRRNDRAMEESATSSLLQPRG